MHRLMQAVAASALLLGVTGASPAHAHHSFAAEFDPENCRDFTGTLTELDWQSPHAFFYVDIADDQGRIDNWSFQTYSLITLRRNGTDRQVFMENIGKEVWIRGCVSRNGREHYAAAGLMRFADGVLRQVGQIQN
jgi:hypothetical protein